MEAVKSKKCYKCNLFKSLELFHKDSSSKDGRKFECKECKSQYRRNYYCSKPELKDYTKNYYKQNKEQVLKKQKKKRNSEEYRSYARAYKKKYLSDPKNKLAHNLRHRIRKALKGNKTNSHIKELGCSVSELKTYLESLFQPGMSWENYGEWHIDHIKPLASFNLLDEKEFCKAANYKNLQPLWAFDNFSKNDSQSDLNR